MKRNSIEMPIETISHSRSHSHLATSNAILTSPARETPTQIQRLVDWNTEILLKTSTYINNFRYHSINLKTLKDLILINIRL